MNTETAQWHRIVDSGCTFVVAVLSHSSTHLYEGSVIMKWQNNRPVYNAPCVFTRLFRWKKCALYAKFYSIYLWQSVTLPICPTLSVCASLFVQQCRRICMCAYSLKCVSVFLFVCLFFNQFICLSHFVSVYLSLPSARHHPSYGDCLEVKREYYQNCSVLDCVTQCSQSAAHLYDQFLQVQQIGFVTFWPLTLCIEAVA